MTATPADVLAAATQFCATLDATLAAERAFLADVSAALSAMHARADAELARIRTLRGEVFPCGTPWPMRPETQAEHLDACADARCAALGSRLLGMVEAA